MINKTAAFKTRLGAIRKPLTWLGMRKNRKSFPQTRSMSMKESFDHFKAKMKPDQHNRSGLRSPRTLVQPEPDCN